MLRFSACTPYACTHSLSSGPINQPPLPIPPLLLQDAESQVLWWVISICDPAAWTPGKAEAAGQAATWRLAKNRNLIVRCGWGHAFCVVRRRAGVAVVGLFLFAACSVRFAGAMSLNCTWA